MRGTAPAFLDTVGAGTVAPGRPPRTRRTGAGLLVALLPVAAALAALAAVTAAGLSQRSALPPVAEPWLYGWFIGRYPLFAFALVYGCARLVAVAAGPGPAGLPRRAVFCLVGVAALALAGLYPTFGGLMLRAGFATGGMAFLTGQPLWLAYVLGAGVCAALFGGIVGLFGILANGRLRPGFARLGWSVLAYLALWFGALALGLGRAFGPWPHRAFRWDEAILAAVLILAACLPHAGLVALRAVRAEHA